VIQIYRAAACFLLPDTAQNLFTFFKFFDSFLYFASVGYSVSNVRNYGRFGGGSAPHTDYILRCFGRTRCLQLHANWIGSSLNKPVIILKEQAAFSSETTEYLITTGCCNQKDNCNLNKNRRENMKNFFQTPD
jgi:hypothetical protein